MSWESCNTLLSFCFQVARSLKWNEIKSLAGWGGCCRAASLLRLPPAVMLWGEQSQRYKGTTDAFWDHVYYFNSQTLLSFKAWWISKSIEAKWLIRSLGAPSTVLASLLWSCHTQSDGCCQALLAKHHSLLLAKKNQFFRQIGKWNPFPLLWNSLPRIFMHTTNKNILRTVWLPLVLQRNALVYYPEHTVHSLPQMALSLLVSVDILKN